MNCCDFDCHQGRDCPARREKEAIIKFWAGAEEEKDEPSIWPEVIAAVALIVAAFSVVAMLALGWVI